MNKLISVFLCALFIVATPMVALAHPGHGTGDGFSITHYLKEPEHIAWLVLLVVGVGYLVVRGKKRASK